VLKYCPSHDLKSEPAHGGLKVKFLKSLTLSLLSFLLFLSLALFGMVFVLNDTLLDPDFIAVQMDRLDVSSLAKELTEEQFSGQIPAEAKALEEALYGVIEDNEPQLKEQARYGIYSFYGYLTGESDRLSLTISLKAIKEDLRDRAWQYFQQNLPPQLSGLPQTMIEPYFDEYYQGFSAQIPSEFIIDESSLGPELMAQIEQARQYLSYIQVGYYALIGFMALLVLGIILINRNVKDTTRRLGVPLLTYGVLEYAGIWVAKYFTPSYSAMGGIPSSLQSWLTQLVDDLLAPLEVFSLGLLVSGIVLLIVSSVYKPRHAEEALVTEEGG